MEPLSTKPAVGAAGIEESDGIQQGTKPPSEYRAPSRLSSSVDGNLDCDCKNCHSVESPDNGAATALTDDDFSDLPVIPEDSLFGTPDYGDESGGTPDGAATPAAPVLAVREGGEGKGVAAAALNMILTTLEDMPLGSPKGTNPFDYGCYSLEELYSLPNSYEWILRGLFCHREIALVYGDSFSGKTYTLVDVLVAIASGNDWCNGLFSSGKPLRCVYTTSEGGRGIGNRFYARETLYREQGGTNSLPISVYRTKTPQLFDMEHPHAVTHFIESMKRRCDQWGEPVSVVAIDTLARASEGADENSARDASMILSGALKIQNELGALVLLNHHESKAGGYRGSTALRGGVDVAIRVMKERDNVHRIRLDKAKDIDPFPDQAFHFLPYEQSSVIQWDGDAAPLDGGNTAARHSHSVAVKELLHGFPGRKFTAKEIAEALNVSAQAVNSAIGSLLGKGVLRSCDDPKSPAGKKNPWRHWVPESSSSDWVSKQGL